MVSMAKAVCIMLMVVGHSGAPSSFTNFMYLFRMPCFFFISGYLLKVKYFATPRQYLTKRVRGYYWPFVKWSVIFLVLHGILYRLGFYETDYTAADYGRKIFGIMTMTGSEQLLGGYWFLKELLYASVISYLTIKFCKINSYKGGWLISLLFALTACAYSFLPFKIPTIGSKTLLASAFFTAGFAYRLMPSNCLKNRWTGIGCMALTIVASLWFIGSMDSTRFDILYYYAIALLGTVGVVDLVQFVPQRLRPALDFIGSRTLYILTFHFICFKLVSLIKIWHLGLDGNHLSDFPVIGISNGIYWIFYSIVGIAVPLILLETWRLVFPKKKKQI